MSSDLSFRTAICSRYERLLKEISHGIDRDRRGTSRLQLKYSRVYSKLRHPERGREMYQFAPRIARPYSARHSKILDQPSSLAGGSLT
jgi:hypothetical protein